MSHALRFRAVAVGLALAASLAGAESNTLTGQPGFFKPTPDGNSSISRVVPPEEVAPKAAAPAAAVPKAAAPAAAPATAATPAAAATARIAAAPTPAATTVAAAPAAAPTTTVATPAPGTPMAPAPAATVATNAVSNPGPFGDASDATSQTAAVTIAKRPETPAERARSAEPDFDRAQREHREMTQRSAQAASTVDGAYNGATNERDR